MVSFLFWNINKNEATFPLIANIAESNEIDIVVLAECTAELAVTLYQINRGRNNKYFYTGFSNCEKIVVLARFNAPELINPIIESSRATIRHLQLPGLIDILLVATHHVSKNNSTSIGQYSEAMRLAQQIKDAENIVGHCRTLLVGDLNMNPFEEGLVSSSALHAISSRQIASRITRKVQGVDYQFFYNPTWNLLGDDRQDTPGTYYYPSSDHVSFFWNTFDQVLIRPDLIDNFNFEEFKVMSKIGEHNFLSKGGMPRKKDISDHLPIIFSLNL